MAAGQPEMGEDEGTRRLGSGDEIEADASLLGAAAAAATGGFFSSSIQGSTKTLLCSR